MIPICQVRLTEDEIQACCDVLRSGNLREGEKTRQFEDQFATMMGVKHAISVTSGTAALHLAYFSLLEPGDEVLVPAFTFISTASMVMLSGAKPVFCDIDPDTWTLSVEECERKKTERTKAVAPVHLFGNSCDIQSIQSFAQQNKLSVIWDAAQALGSQYKGKSVASYADIACFSFYPTKNMTTGEGGMITTDSDELAQKIRALKSHGESDRYQHPSVGFNYRITDLQAVLGIFQLEKVQQFIAKRKQVAQYYIESFKNNPAIQLQKETSDSNPSYNYFSIGLQLDKLNVSRDEFVQQLKDEGVQSAVHYPIPLNKQPCFESSETLSVSESLANRIVALPIHPYLNHEDIEIVANTINKLTS